MVIELLYPRAFRFWIKNPENGKTSKNNEFIFYEIDDGDIKIRFKVPLQDNKVLYPDGRQEADAMYNVLDFEAELRYIDSLSFESATILIHENDNSWKS